MSKTTRPIVWTIAGSDSGGGAGVQADLLTIHDLGGHGCSVITAITAQSSVAVDHVEAISTAGFIAQLDTLWADLPPKAIKIGLLAGDEQIAALAAWFAKHQQALPPVILDPVMVASSGAMLCATDAATQFEPLLPFATVITPNGDELAALTGMVIDSPEAVLAACAQLVERGANAVLAKGGHFDHIAVNGDQCVDLLYHAKPVAGGQRQLFAGKRIATNNTHGSGCTLSSAWATTLALGYDLLDGFTVTRGYLTNGLTASQQLGQGPGPLARTGWPTELSSLPIIPLENSDLANAYGICAEAKLPVERFAECDTHELGVYPVVDSLEWVARLLQMGVKTLQLRIKDKALAEVEADIAAAIALGHQHQARLFINDYWPLAVKHGAYGVHLGQEDMAVADLAAIQQAGLRLGLSTHGYYEIARAHGIGPSYIALGHIFPTPTKDMPSAPQGLARLARYAALLQPHYPTVAIGGIDIDRAPLVAATGIGSIAVVRAVTQAEDPQAALLALEQAYREHAPRKDSSRG
ncbi:thiamine phosphate synthase [Ferrimonas senticii]|uniref:thiamine phosphate synthase n=1 Tax=Ferrimonas senticii TaxID=394566 RepID=UPI0003FC7437|nr:thiamine phosphate synthase [Ferrimonas senticii]